MGLYLVATPIGNLEDITIRALNTLKEADIIAAEDTRQTLKLLNHFEIKKPLVSYHEHNKRESGEKILALLQEGKRVALVTDAGTPGISDPGEDIVRLAVENNFRVYLAPGAAACIYALVVSALPTSRFVFEGFLPRENRERRERFEVLLNEQRTMIFYEAPHRIVKTLGEMYENFGNRRIAICRELTKLHEEIIRCTLEEAKELYNDKEPRGEYVIVLEGKTKDEIDREKQAVYENFTIEEHIRKYIDSGMTKKDAVKTVAKERNLNKSEVYKYSIDI